MEAKIDDILDRYKSHPSIVMIERHVKITTKFQFKDTNTEKDVPEDFSSGFKKGHT